MTAKPTSSCGSVPDYGAVKETVMADIDVSKDDDNDNDLPAHNELLEMRLRLAALESSMRRTTTKAKQLHTEAQMELQNQHARPSQAQSSAASNSAKG